MSRISRWMRSQGATARWSWRTRAHDRAAAPGESMCRVRYRVAGAEHADGAGLFAHRGDAAVGHVMRAVQRARVDATSGSWRHCDGLGRRSGFLLNDPDGLELLLATRPVHDDRRPGRERRRRAPEGREIHEHALSVVGPNHDPVARDGVHRAPEFRPTRARRPSRYARGRFRLTDRVRRSRRLDWCQLLLWLLRDVGIG